MTRLILAALLGLLLGASLAASEIPSFRILTPPGTPSLTFAALLVGVVPETTTWGAVWGAALPGMTLAALQALLATAIGAGILHRLLPRLGPAAAWGLGILPGSLVLLPAIRLAADAARISDPTALPWILTGGGLGLTAAAWRVRPPPPSRTAAAISILLLALLLVFNVQFGALHVTGDSSNLIHALPRDGAIPRIPLQPSCADPRRRIARGQTTLAVRPLDLARRRTPCPSLDGLARPGRPPSRKTRMGARRPRGLPLSGRTHPAALA
jgi:hypothetical protein